MALVTCDVIVLQLHTVPCRCYRVVPIFDFEGFLDMV